MRQIKTIAFTMLVITLFNSCSKEKKFERMLYKSDGRWTITDMTYTLITEDENYNHDTVSATVQNPGVFEFKENNVGNYNFIIEGLPHHESFSWNSVSESSLSITRNAEQIDFWAGSVTYLVIALTGERTDKKKITLTGKESIEKETDYGYSTSELTATFMLEKK